VDCSWANTAHKRCSHAFLNSFTSQTLLKEENVRDLNFDAKCHERQIDTFATVMLN
jgi:hypothetical protein